MSEKKLCDTCLNCFIKTYKTYSPDNETENVIKICLIDKLHLRNDIINLNDLPIKCNRYNPEKI